MHNAIFTAQQRLATKIEELGLSATTKAALRRHGVETVRDLLSVGDARSIKGIKWSRAQEIRKARLEIGIPERISHVPDQMLLELVANLAQEEGREAGETCKVAIGFHSSWRDVLRATRDGSTHAEVGWTCGDNPLTPTGLARNKVFLPLDIAMGFLLRENHPPSSYHDYRKQKWQGEVQLRKYRSTGDIDKGGNILLCVIRNVTITTEHEDFSEDGKGELTFHPRDIEWAEPDPPA